MLDTRRYRILSKTWRALYEKVDIFLGKFVFPRYSIEQNLYVRLKLSLCIHGLILATKEVDDVNELKERCIKHFYDKFGARQTLWLYTILAVKACPTFVRPCLLHKIAQYTLTRLPSLHMPRLHMPRRRLDICTRLPRLNMSRQDQIPPGLLYRFGMKCWSSHNGESAWDNAWRTLLPYCQMLLHIVCFTQPNIVHSVG